MLLPSSGWNGQAGKNPHQSCYVSIHLSDQKTEVLVYVTRFGRSQMRFLPEDNISNFLIFVVPILILPMSEVHDGDHASQYRKPPCMSINDYPIKNGNFTWRTWIMGDSGLFTFQGIQAGMPHSSILAPTLYSLYMNETSPTTGVYLVLFADDTYTHSHTHKRCRRGLRCQKLQHRLTSMESLCERSNIKISEDKTSISPIDEDRSNLILHRKDNTFPL
jgi:hypothetical protein